MYQLSILPYSFQELEPFIDTHTMGLHYHKHEMAYLNNLNNLLKKYNYNYRYSLNDLVYHINEFNDDDKPNILFNLGGVLNHELYWKSMNKNSNLPKGKLKNKIDSQYGDIGFACDKDSSLQEEFENTFSYELTSDQQKKRLLN